MRLFSKCHGGVFWEASTSPKPAPVAFVMMYGQHQALEDADGIFMRGWEDKKLMVVPKRLM